MLMKKHKLYDKQNHNALLFINVVKVFVAMIIPLLLQLLLLLLLLLQQQQQQQQHHQQQLLQ